MEMTKPTCEVPLRLAPLRCVPLHLCMSESHVGYRSGRDWNGLTYVSLRWRAEEAIPIKCFGNMASRLDVRIIIHCKAVVGGDYQ